MWKRIMENRRLAIQWMIAFVGMIILYNYLPNVGDTLGGLPYGKIALYSIITIAVFALVVSIWRVWRNRKRSLGSGWRNYLPKVGSLNWKLIPAVPLGIILALNGIVLGLMLKSNGDIGGYYFFHVYFLQSWGFWVPTVLIFLQWVTTHWVEKSVKGLSLFVYVIMIGAAALFFWDIIPGFTGGKNPFTSPEAGNSNRSSDVSMNASTSGGTWENKTGPDIAYIQNRFGPTSLLSRIAACESGYRQYSDPINKIPLRNPSSSAMGAFQIMESVHKFEADSLARVHPNINFDLSTLEGNSNFAEWLLEQEGTAPWVTSQQCWSGDGNYARPFETQVAVAVRGTQEVRAVVDSQVVVPGDTTIWTEKLFVRGSHGHKFHLGLVTEKEASFMVHAGYEDGREEDVAIIPGEDNRNGLGENLSWVRVRNLSEEPLVLKFSRREMYY